MRALIFQLCLLVYSSASIHFVHTYCILTFHLKSDIFNVTKWNTKPRKILLMIFYDNIIIGITVEMWKFCAIFVLWPVFLNSWELIQSLINYYLVNKLKNAGLVVYFPVCIYPLLDYNEIWQPYDGSFH